MTIKRYSKTSVEELVQRIQAGEKLAFGELYDRYVKTVFNKCLSFTHDRDQAEDITQDIFIKVFEKLDEFDNQNFGGWLMRLTYNQCVDFTRKSNTRRKVKEGFLWEGDLDEHIDERQQEEVIFGMQLNALKVILIDMDPADRSMLILKYQEEKKVREVATLFGIGESAVKMRLKRARAYIVKRYENEFRTEPI